LVLSGSLLLWTATKVTTVALASLFSDLTSDLGEMKVTSESPTTHEVIPETALAVTPMKRHANTA
jgi:hypothetical protein